MLMRLTNDEINRRLVIETKINLSTIPISHFPVSTEIIMPE